MAALKNEGAVEGKALSNRRGGTNRESNGPKTPRKKGTEGRIACNPRAPFFRPQGDRLILSLKKVKYEKEIKGREDQHQGDVHIIA